MVQPVIDVSPPKWHLGHTTWFFETFILVTNKEKYKVFDKNYDFVFNSYYETVGKRVLRADRGNLTRPSVEDIYKYRNYVEEQVLEYFDSISEIPAHLLYVIELGLQHEQQHQELLLYDIKYILGHNPLFPTYVESPKSILESNPPKLDYLEVSAGNYEIGYKGNDFYFDNEKGIHKVYLHDFKIASRLVSNGEYLEFMETGGYKQFQYWFSEAWEWVKKENKEAPMYWHKIDSEWYYYTLHGLLKLNLDEPVAHISMFEADAFAKWKNMRLPTEFEWEVACHKFNPSLNPDTNFVEKENYAPTYQPNTNQFYGDLWEWTDSAYRPYPYFKTDKGAIGEYNGKFMINQMVLRGGSYATPQNHIRPTYRNFFPPHLQWQCAGIRLASYC